MPLECRRIYDLIEIITMRIWPMGTNWTTQYCMKYHWNEVRMFIRHIDDLPQCIGARRGKVRPTNVVMFTLFDVNNVTLISKNHRGS